MKCDIICTMGKQIKGVRFRSRTKNSFLVNADGKVKTLHKHDFAQNQEITQGGMWTKLEAAWIATQAGIPVIIAKG